MILTFSLHSPLIPKITVDYSKTIAKCLQNKTWECFVDWKPQSNLENQINMLFEFQVRQNKPIRNKWSDKLGVYCGSCTMYLTFFPHFIVDFEHHRWRTGVNSANFLPPLYIFNVTCALQSLTYEEIRMLKFSVFGVQIRTTIIIGDDCGIWWRDFLILCFWKEEKEEMSSSCAGMCLG